jgi:ABC-type sugar transport system permease subunit
VDFNRAFNWVMAYVLRWTVGAAIFGFILELILSQSTNLAYRYEVPIYIVFVIFSLALSGGIVALYFSWLLQRYKNG